MTNDHTIHQGSGNIYKDLGFADCEQMQAKAILASQIVAIIEKKKWTQRKAAEVLELTQPKISLLVRGQFSRFSIGKLINLLNKLNQDIEIVIKPKPFSARHIGHVNVVFGSA